MKLEAISTQIKTDILGHSYLHIIAVYILYRDELVAMMNNQLYQKSFYLQEFIQWGNRSHR